jgi:hypothetical protein
MKRTPTTLALAYLAWGMIVVALLLVVVQCFIFALDMGQMLRETAPLAAFAFMAGVPALLLVVLAGRRGPSIEGAPTPEDEAETPVSTLDAAYSQGFASGDRVAREEQAITDYCDGYKAACGQNMDRITARIRLRLL